MAACGAARAPGALGKPDRRRRLLSYQCVTRSNSDEVAMEALLRQQEKHLPEALGAALEFRMRQGVAVPLPRRGAAPLWASWHQLWVVRRSYGMNSGICIYMCK